MAKLLKNPLVAILLTVITIIFYISLSKTQQKTQIVSSKVEETKKENEKLEVESRVLEEKLQNQDHEEIIRDEFLMQKPGEYVVKVPSLPEKDNTEDETKEESNLEKWMELLF